MEDVAARDFDVLPEIVIRAYTSGGGSGRSPSSTSPGSTGPRTLGSSPSASPTCVPFAACGRRATTSGPPTTRTVPSTAGTRPSATGSARGTGTSAGLLEAGQRVLDVGCGSSRLLGALPAGSVGLDLLMGKLRRVPAVRAEPASGPTPWACPSATEPSTRSSPRRSWSGSRPAGTPSARWSRVLRPGGRLILATPDYGRRRWRFLGALYDRIVPGAGDQPPLARYSRRRLIDEVESRGLSLDADARDILGAEMILVFRKQGRLRNLKSQASKSSSREDECNNRDLTPRLHGCVSWVRPLPQVQPKLMPPGRRGSPSCRRGLRRSRRGDRRRGPRPARSARRTRKSTPAPEVDAGGGQHLGLLTTVPGSPADGGGAGADVRARPGRSARDGCWPSGA